MLNYGVCRYESSQRSYTSSKIHCRTDAAKSFLLACAGGVHCAQRYHRLGTVRICHGTATAQRQTQGHVVRYLSGTLPRRPRRFPSYRAHLDPCRVRPHRAGPRAQIVRGMPPRAAECQTLMRYEFVDFFFVCAESTTHTNTHEHVGGVSLLNVLRLPRRLPGAP